MKTCKYFRRIIYFLIGLTLATGIYVVTSYFKTSVEQAKEFTISTIHGTMTTNDQLVIDLINSPAMQRLKKLHQYGTPHYVVKRRLDYTRFEHSLGVYYILHKHGASRAEQVAGLLHDISHTVFSHACDPLFMGNITSGAYQDTIHEEFLARHGIKEILEKHGLSIKDVSLDHDNCKALKQKYPALCADRIEYNIFAAYMDNLLSEEDIASIHRDLHLDGNNWYFDTVESARKFALIPLHQTLYSWTGPIFVLIGHWTSCALRRAMDMGLVTKEEICFEITDDEMWHILSNSTDPEIRSYMNKITQAPQLFSWAHEYNQQATILKTKCSGIDPWVKTDQGLVLLSTLDPAFKHDYETTKKIVHAGWHIIVHESPTTNTHHELDPRSACIGVQPLEVRSNVKSQ